ncbi:hypothetical protein BCR44DRAFT_1457804 [Catenaria anguillulae PL171]|uniref:Uncharacterized protein n=1 Tax=Catenaria anguillulae PL171 TaxID=765915 RepID=A0A1Y2I170_9FUNG|nr:hypothetical protein BCR44DRAFT_1457804 [Catenaria anguillulae PL171]
MGRPARPLNNPVLLLILLAGLLSLTSSSTHAAPVGPLLTLPPFQSGTCGPPAAYEATMLAVFDIKPATRQQHYQLVYDAAAEFNLCGQRRFAAFVAQIAYETDKLTDFEDLKWFQQSAGALVLQSKYWKPILEWLAASNPSIARELRNDFGRTDKVAKDIMMRPTVMYRVAGWWFTTGAARHIDADCRLMTQYADRLRGDFGWQDAEMLDAISFCVHATTILPPGNGARRDYAEDAFKAFGRVPVPTSTTSTSSRPTSTTSTTASVVSSSVRTSTTTLASSLHGVIAGSKLQDHINVLIAEHNRDHINGAELLECAHVGYDLYHNKLHRGHYIIDCDHDHELFYRNNIVKWRLNLANHQLDAQQCSDDWYCNRSTRYGHVDPSRRYRNQSVDLGLARHWHAVSSRLANNHFGDGYDTHIEWRLKHKVLDSGAHHHFDCSGCVPLNDYIDDFGTDIDHVHERFNHNHGGANLRFHVYRAIQLDRDNHNRDGRIHLDCDDRGAHCNDHRQSHDDQLDGGNVYVYDQLCTSVNDDECGRDEHERYIFESNDQTITTSRPASPTETDTSISTDVVTPTWPTEPSRTHVATETASSTSGAGTTPTITEPTATSTAGDVTRATSSSIVASTFTSTDQIESTPTFDAPSSSSSPLATPTTSTVEETTATASETTTVSEPSETISTSSSSDPLPTSSDASTTTTSTQSGSTSEMTFVHLPADFHWYKHGFKCDCQWFVMDELDLHLRPQLTISLNLQSRQAPELQRAKHPSTTSNQAEPSTTVSTETPSSTTTSQDSATTTSVRSTLPLTTTSQDTLTDITSAETTETPSPSQATTTADPATTSLPTVTTSTSSAVDSTTPTSTATEATSSSAVGMRSFTGMPIHGADHVLDICRTYEANYPRVCCADEFRAIHDVKHNRGLVHDHEWTDIPRNLDHIDIHHTNVERLTVHHKPDTNYHTCHLFKHTNQHSLSTVHELRHGNQHKFNCARADSGVWPSPKTDPVDFANHNSDDPASRARVRNASSEVYGNGDDDIGFSADGRWILRAAAASRRLRQPR